MRRRNNEPRIYGPYQHGERYRVHIITTSGGRRTAHYQTYATRALAEAFVAGARDEAQGVTVRQAVDAFLAWKRDDKGAVQNTLDNYEHRLGALLGLPANDSRPVRWTLRRGAELYDASIKRDGDSNRASDTHINGLSVGRMWGKFCVKQKLLKANPFADVEAKGKRARGAHKPRLSVNESRTLEAFCFEHAHNPDCVLTYGYLMLGKRASELVGVTARDLDDDGWLLRIRDAKTEASIGAIGVPVRLRGMLLELAKGLAPEAHLFTNQSGKPMTRFVARDRVKAILLAAKVTVLPPQALRRTFIDNASRQGQTLRSIADMVGHETTAVTKRSYMSPEQAETSAVERNFQVIAGGRK